MVTQIHLGEMAVDVVFKDIKNIHLSVYPPEGKVRISAPLRLNIDTIRVFAITKLAWIRQQQAKLRAQHRETPREYLNRESHYVWGKRYLLKVIELDDLPKIELNHHQIQLYVRPATTQEQKQILIEQWYRETLKDVIQSLIMKWEPIMGVKVERFFVQRMKTKWGSCNPLAKSIRLNTDLAKKPPECLEYIVVHEMTRLLEPSHNQRFISLMDEFLPKWRF
ncbi:MAG: M48 family peptidase [Methylococcales bacterium]|nr:MAG: M48 family peptidase [Methylococcales bacterium]